MASTSPRYDGSDSERIDLSTARQWAESYRKANPGQVRSHYFGRNVLDQILAQPGCTGVRVYYALNANNEKELLVVGVDNQGNSMLPASPVIVPGDFAIMDYSFPCPPFCPPGADL
jgi:hypothetical protein